PSQQLGPRNRSSLGMVRRIRWRRSRCGAAMENPERHGCHVIRSEGSVRVLLGFQGLAQEQIFTGHGRHRLKLPLVIIFLALTSCQAGKERRGVMSSILETEYWSTAANESLPLSLTLSSAGAAKLWIRSNRDDVQKRVLGFFEVGVPARFVSEVNAAVTSAEFSD